MKAFLVVLTVMGQWSGTGTRVYPMPDMETCMASLQAAVVTEPSEGGKAVVMYCVPERPMALDEWRDRPESR